MDSCRISAMVRLVEKAHALKGKARSSAFENLVYSKLGFAGLMGSSPEKLLEKGSYSCDRQWADRMEESWSLTGPVIYRLISLSSDFYLHLGERGHEGLLRYLSENLYGVDNNFNGLGHYVYGGLARTGSVRCGAVFELMKKGLGDGEGAQDKFKGMFFVLNRSGLSVVRAAILENNESFLSEFFSQGFVYEKGELQIMLDSLCYDRTGFGTAERVWRELVDAGSDLGVMEEILCDRLDVLGNSQIETLVGYGRLDRAFKLLDGVRDEKLAGVAGRLMQKVSVVHAPKIREYLVGRLGDVWIEAADRVGGEVSGCGSVGRGVKRAPNF